VFAGVSGQQDISGALTLYISGRMEGSIEPCGCVSNQIGGLARRDSFFIHLGKESAEAILIENGNLTTGRGKTDPIKFQTIVSALNKMGYDILNLGEKDATLGLDFLKNVEQRAKFYFLSANLATTNGKHPFQPSVVVTRQVDGKPVRVGFIGVIGSVLGSRVRPTQEKFVMDDPAQAIESELPKLRPKADIIILLAHTTVDDAKKLADKFPEIDLVLHGYGGAALPSIQPNRGSTTRARLVGTGNAGKYLGKLDLAIDKDRKVVSKNLKAVSMGEKIPDSPDVRDMINLYLTAVKAKGLSDPGTTRTQTRGGTYIGSIKCQACHMDEFKVWQKSRHLQAAKTLVSEGKQNDTSCLRCHTTGWGYPTGFVSVEKTAHMADVGCESCHGVGSNHAANPKKGYGKVSAKDCTRCHDRENSPNFKYTKALAKISHKKPKETKPPGTPRATPRAGNPALGGPQARAPKGQ